MGTRTKLLTAAVAMLAVALALPAFAQSICSPQPCDDHPQETVAIVNGNAPADALLAATLDSDVLYVTQDTVPDVTANALFDYGDPLLLVIGGPDAVSDDVMHMLSQVMGLDVERVGGADRFATAVEVASRR